VGTFCRGEVRGMEMVEDLGQRGLEDVYLLVMIGILNKNSIVEDLMEFRSVFLPSFFRP
jgi:hypothetical protein